MGSDSNEGTEASPYLSVAKAMEKAKSVKSEVKDEVKIQLEAGEYFIESPLTLNETDGGVNGNRIVISGDENNETVINAGKYVENWTNEGGNIWKADLTNILGNKSLRQFYVDDQPMTRAKSGIFKSTSAYREASDGPFDGVSANGLPTIEATSIGDAEIVFEGNFQQYRYPIESVTNGNVIINETAFAKVIENDTTPYSRQEMMADSKISFYLENNKAFLDEEGEFCYDKDEKILYYYTESDPTTKECVVPVSEGYLTIAGTSSKRVENIIIENLTFKNGTWLLPSTDGLAIDQADTYRTAPRQSFGASGGIIPGQIQLNWCDNVIFRNNKVINSGSESMSIREGVKNTVVSGNVFKNSMAGAINVGSHKHTFEAYNERMCRDVEIKNNVIVNTGLNYPASPAITLYYTQDITVSHNNIKNTTYTGISLGWGWQTDYSETKNNTIEYNHIETTMTHLHDGAHIYTNGSQTGGKIYGNYLKDSRETDYNGWGLIGRGGLYFDDGSDHLEAYNNVVEDCGVWMFCTSQTADSTVVVRDTYTDTSNFVNKRYIDGIVANGTEKIVTISNTNLQTSGWSQDAQNIINNSGVESEYSALRSYLN